MMGILMHMSPKRLYSSLFTASVLCTFIFWMYFASNPRVPPLHIPTPVSNPASTPSSSALLVNSVAKYFIDYALGGPEYKQVFGELGQRVQILTNWIATQETGDRKGPVDRSIEQLGLSMFPFIRNPSHPNDPTPLDSLRSSYIPGSAGIIIPVGLQDFRYACHLVVVLRKVLHSSLPIQIAYAGDADLPLVNREILTSLAKDVEFLDVLTVLDNESMKLGKDWAIKPFAALASKYEQVIVVDADAVFLQRPEYLFLQRGYKENGALFFHDRLLWQHGFPQRHEWWKKQMEYQKPSPELMKSLVWTQEYAEEADSGVVVLDKGRLPIFTGLLHISWQLTEAVREQATYRMTYGDKESWWFGLELCGVPYTFEKHYGGVIGYIREKDDKRDVCGFTISHVDEKDQLFWFNGSLLKNKHANKTEFIVPTHWMMDANWQKGATKVDMSCMTGGTATPLDRKEIQILEQSVEAAQSVDAQKALV